MFEVADQVLSMVDALSVTFLDDLENSADVKELLSTKSFTPKTALSVEMLMNMSKQYSGYCQQVLSQQETQTPTTSSSENIQPMDGATCTSFTDVPLTNKRGLAAAINSDEYLDSSLNAKIKSSTVESEMKKLGENSFSIYSSQEGKYTKLRCPIKVGKGLEIVKVQIYEIQDDAKLKFTQNIIVPSEFAMHYLAVPLKKMCHDLKEKLLTDPRFKDRTEVTGGELTQSWAKRFKSS